jgi:prepilin signal peptidase PulO-like enzyme (type II secretory pathway)
MLLTIYLIFLGLCFGSFINALVWRIHEKKDWVRARSQCTHCGHQLAAKDLVPVFSWLYLRGRCRYCKKPIDDTPLVEISAAAVFVLSYIFWPEPLHGGQIILLITWLACSVGLLALLVYDLKWMLLPNSILYPTLIAAVVGNAVYLIGFEHHKLHAAMMWILSVLVASGIFWILFMVSRGKWIGYGDVRLGWVTGTLLLTPFKSLLMIFGASVIGTLVAVPLITLGKRKMSAKIPFGPYLITAAFICMLFGDNIIDWYKKVFLP